MDNSPPILISVISYAIALIVVVAVVIGQWKMYVKANQPGWAVLIPIYNLYVLMQIIGRPGWHLLLYLLPLVNIVISFIHAMDLARVFGRGGAFGFFGLFLFSGLGQAILGFGKDAYQGPSGITTPPPSQPPTPATQPQVSTPPLNI